MEKIKILAFLISLLLIGCNSKKLDNTIKNISYDDFHINENLDYEILNLDTIWKPNNIYYSNNKLIIIDKTQDFFAQVFDLEKKTKVCENIPFGVGPHESVGCWSLEITNDYILSFCLQSGYLIKYSKNDFLSKSKIDIIDTYDVGDYYPSTMVLLSNGNLLASSLEDTNNALSLFDRFGNKIDNKTTFPILTNTQKFGDFEKKIAFENRIYYSEANQKIVVPYAYTDIIDIYDIDLNLVSRIHGPIGFEPIMSDKNGMFGPSASCTKVSCVIACLSKNYIWLVYNEGKDPNTSKQLLVFDYKGNPISVYNFNINIHGIAVDEDNNTIYSIAEIPEINIVKFKYKIND
ncbi:MAG: TolB-like 6-bladed beta-propeller domain-containing protein [Bacteroidales bacterium]|nr:TolB-like 6-bladed beta-propeller domain-containing protein [Bacteroidales bacterium]